MEWLTKLSASLKYIEAHLEDEISYEAAAKIACCSVSYFQRMFSYVTGISLAEYIRRRRMTQAAFALQAGGARITEIALRYGYTSPTAFNRAFRGVHGVSPLAARRNAPRLAVYPPLRLKVTVTGDACLSYRMEEKAAFRIVGRRIPLKEDVEENRKLVPHFWRAMWRENHIPEILRLSQGEGEDLLGVSQYENSGRLYYTIGVVSGKQAPEEMAVCEIPPATWVVMESNGAFPVSVQALYRRFVTEWLPFSGYRYAGLPDIEFYPGGRCGQAGGQAEIWLAVEKK